MSRQYPPLNAFMMTCTTVLQGMQAVQAAKESDKTSGKRNRGPAGNDRMMPDLNCGYSSTDSTPPPGKRKPQGKTDNDMQTAQDDDIAGNDRMLPDVNYGYSSTDSTSPPGKRKPQGKTDNDMQTAQDHDMATTTLSPPSFSVEKMSIGSKELTFDSQRKVSIWMRGAICHITMSPGDANESNEDTQDINFNIASLMEANSTKRGFISVYFGDDKKVDALVIGFGDTPSAYDVYPPAALHSWINYKASPPFNAIVLIPKVC